MAVHHAEVVVAAPSDHVYALWSHFNDYPKFMSHVREVTYLDDERSHWVVDVLGTHAWDAVNDGWIPGRRIGWRAISGMNNRGSVQFEPAGAKQTRVVVEIDYTPPAGALGALAEALAAGGALERALQSDLDHFAQMVREAPPGALDPTSSSYLFHAQSAAARGTATAAQQQTMGAGPGDANPRSTTSTTHDANLGDLPGDEGLAQDAVPHVPGTTISSRRP